MSYTEAGSPGRDRANLDTGAVSQIVVEAGATVVGGAGKNVFVLTAQASQDESVALGVIVGFVDGEDVLDLSQLGPNASVLEDGPTISGATRLSIDFDGDGQEDGYLLLGGSGVVSGPSLGGSNGGVIDEDLYHILPFPEPTDGPTLGGGSPVNGDTPGHTSPSTPTSNAPIKLGGALAVQAVDEPAFGIAVAGYTLSQHDYEAIMAA